jgi:hypothetical protein
MEKLGRDRLDSEVLQDREKGILINAFQESHVEYD